MYWKIDEYIEPDTEQVWYVYEYFGFKKLNHYPKPYYNFTTKEMEHPQKKELLIKLIYVLPGDDVEELIEENERFDRD